MDVYKKMGIRRVINARGCATLAGGTLIEPDALAAFVAAANAFARIEDLQETASEVIAEVTGAEAGYVTSGAAAAITLATAACIAGLDVDKMDQLPATEGMPSEILIQRVHRNPYDHAVRAAGATLVEFGAPDSTESFAMREAIGPHTVGAFFHAEKENAGLRSQEFIGIAHDSEIPVIVDAAMSLPPASNLRRFTEEGADLVAFSGGKTIRAPQSSGFLAGRRDLMLSVALQHQDMDVRASTWSRRKLVSTGRLSRHPGQGIGRSMKVGKEEIVALIVALQRYVERDHSSDLRRWHTFAEELAAGLGVMHGLKVSIESESPTGRPVPSVVVEVSPTGYGMPAVELVNRLQEQDPIILVNDYEAETGRLRIDPENMSRPEIERVVSAFIFFAAGPRVETAGL